MFFINHALKFKYKPNYLKANGIQFPSLAEYTGHLIMAQNHKCAM